MKDELNVFEDYFGEMEITPEQKKKRIRLAEEFLEVFLFVFAYAKRTDSEKELQEVTAKRMQSIIPIKDDYIKKYILLISASIAKTTLESEAEYYTSYARAWNMAANEANSVANYSDYVEAVKTGYTKKTWISERDNRVRLSHEFADGQTVPIDDVFVVNGSIMRFPQDQMYNPSPSETCGCRCTALYK